MHTKQLQLKKISGHQSGHRTSLWKAEVLTSDLFWKLDGEGSAPRMGQATEQCHAGRLTCLLFDRPRMGRYEWSNHMLVVLGRSSTCPSISWSSEMFAQF
jgi:hypothetical protein